MVLAGVIAVSTTDTEVQNETICLLYDDRKDLSGLIGQSASNVSISNESVTSCAAGSERKDAHVLTYENGKLYAVGVGTATLTVDGTAYAVTVEPAPISLFMIIGHSVGAGQEGTASQSVAVEAGQAYSSCYYQSFDIGNNLYRYFYENPSATEAHFEDTSAKDLTAVTLTPGEQKSVVPVLSDIRRNFTVTMR